MVVAAITFETTRSILGAFNLDKLIGQCIAGPSSKPLVDIDIGSRVSSLCAIEKGHGNL